MKNKWIWDAGVGLGIVLVVAFGLWYGQTAYRVVDHVDKGDQHIHYLEGTRDSVVARNQVVEDSLVEVKEEFDSLQTEHGYLKVEKAQVENEFSKLQRREKYYQKKIKLYEGSPARRTALPRLDRSTLGEQPD